MLKLIVLIIIVQIISNDASSFPEDMYHGKKLTTLQNFLRTQGLQTKPSERHKQVHKHYPLAALMPYKCNERQISNVYQSKEYGKIGFSGRTYTEKYYPKGKYFPDSYDKKCICPVFRDEQWNPEIKWTTVYSGEYLNDTAAVEVLRSKAIVKRRCNLQYTFNYITYCYNQIPNMRDAFLFTSHLLAYYYECYQWVSWNFNVSHYKNFTYKNLTHTSPNTNPVPPCYLNPEIHDKFVYIPPFKLERLLLRLIRDKISECNYSQFGRWETKPNGEIIFMIPGGSFQPILPYRHKRSNFHYVGIGTLIFQWRE